MTPAAKAAKELNRLGKLGEPALFIIDFLAEKPVIIPLRDVNPKDILYEIKGSGNLGSHELLKETLIFNKFPIGLQEYEQKFNKVRHHIKHGDTYLLNLTCPTPISLNFTLRQVFHAAKAKYKLLFGDTFVVFSPETFIEIRGGKIITCPMKGTIDASIPDAGKKILDDKKETAEQYTIVDLLRNDLGMVSKNVRVEKFRYIEEILTGGKTLLQVSSRITGLLPDDYTGRIGDILFALLPAGSITGAPKKKTVEIILNTEGYARGYYTGVFGIFDGRDLDCAVMIRYIEKTSGGLVFKSGGGITSLSDCKMEYDEMIDKVYVPIV